MTGGSRADRENPGRLPYIAIGVPSRYGPATRGDKNMVSRTPSNATGQEETGFGFARVPLTEKQRLVDDVFSRVAGRYDVMNDLMSGGLHRLWKDVLVSMVRPAATRPFAHLDVAGGTGDVAFRVAKAGGRRTKVTVLDINAQMLAVGKARARRLDLLPQIDFIRANAEQLPLLTGSFDAYTVAFGIRNVAHIDQAFREAQRVLKIGGRFLCLEFSKVDVPGLDWLYQRFSFSIIPAIGQIVVGDREPYRYLVESIDRFPQPEALAGLIEAAGFRRVGFTRLAGGIVAIHSGWKL
jgi:demethylmenaquinone methyltransferase / 2-methoxy-6-polyprenyl-1,4-benzoquinol methylase